MIQSWMLPTAEVLVGGQKRKFYGKKKNKLYLNDGEEFQIRLKNPSPYKVGVAIKINGEYEGKLLILPAYKDFILDRFISDRKKYIFKTYEILGSAEDVKAAVQKNGTISVEFFKEKSAIWDVFVTASTSGCSGCSGSSGTGGYGGSYSTLSNTQGMGPIVRSLPGSVQSPGIYANETDHSYLAESITTTGDIQGSKINLTGDFTEINITNRNSRTYEPTPMVKAETGRIEKGDKSKQKFEETAFEKSESIAKFKFKLLPISVKENKKKLPSSPSPTKQFGEDLHTEGIIKKIDNVYYFPNSSEMRIYCSNSNCGYRIRNRSWKFCPSCGRKIK